MNVWVEKDEAYPVFTLHKDAGKGYYSGPIDIPAELYERFQAASKEFWKLHDEIEGLLTRR